MPDYSAGNLELQIQAVSENTIASLDKVNDRLKTMMTLLGNVSTAFTTTSKSSSLLNKTKFNLNGNGGGGSFIGATTSAFGLTKLLNRIYFLRNYTSNLFRQLGQGLQNAINFTETLNLWQVAMRGNRAEAEKFVTTMNRAYGISEQTLMNYQAIFRNMLTSLGGISENTTYALSEYLTQMALDYASLYNTTTEKAMTTFQSVLSGQVRPIRSIAGYDITETTIYQLYQQLGGTKTQRALSQTEKRLLRIYAVFQQMDRSGAIGDLRKTLESTANQMRVMDDRIKELSQWFGIFIDQTVNPALPYINAFLITVKDIVKALALASGYKPPEFGVERVEEYNNELDELQGKLLSFDRFEALNTAQDNNALAIDRTILSGFEQYQSILSGVTSKTQDLVNQWHDFWFTVDENGVERLSDRGKQILDLLGAISITFGVLAGYGLASKVAKLAGAFLGLNSATSLLNFTLTTGIIFSIVEAVRLFKEGDYWGGILASTIGVTLVAAFILLNQKAIIGLWTSLGQRLLPMIFNVIIGFKTMENSLLTLSISALSFAGALGIGLAILNFIPEKHRKTAGLIMTIAGAFMALTAAVLAFNSVITWGAALPFLTAGVGLAISGIMGQTNALNNIANSVQTRKNGGFVEDGLFTMSKGEIIGDFDDGTTVVANNQQIIEGIRQGVYGAVVSALGNRQSGGVGDVYLDGRKVGIATAQSSRREQVRVGMARVNK